MALCLKLGKVLKVSNLFRLHYWFLSVFCPLIYRVLLFCVSGSPCPSKTAHRTRSSSGRVIPSNVDLVSFLRTTAVGSFFFSAWNTVGHGKHWHQHHIAKSFPTQLTQLTISCISVRRLSLHVFNFCRVRKGEEWIPIDSAAFARQWNEKKKYFKWKRKKKAMTQVQSSSVVPRNSVLILLFILFLYFCVIFPVHVFVPPRIEMCRRKLSVRVAAYIAIGVAESIGLDTAWTIWTLCCAAVDHDRSRPQRIANRKEKKRKKKKKKKLFLQLYMRIPYFCRVCNCFSPAGLRISRLQQRCIICFLPYPPAVELLWTLCTLRRFLLSLSLTLDSLTFRCSAVRGATRCSVKRDERHITRGMKRWEVRDTRWEENREGNMTKAGVPFGTTRRTQSMALRLVHNWGRLNV